MLAYVTWCYCALGLDISKGTEEFEKIFNELSTEERMKLDGETLVNVDNIKKRQSLKGVTSTGLTSEFIVVTILLAVRNVDELPSINCKKDLKEALEKLGSIVSHQILAVEVLWTPQNENDSLPEKKLLQDYPLLRTLEGHDTQIDCHHSSKMDDKKCE
ncbi:Tubulin-specific chaperone E [Bienertia sinuspersici]